MIMKCNKVLNQDRGEIGNVNHRKLYHEILKENRAVDIKENHIVTDLGNGYCKITIIDKNKTY